MRHLVHRSDRCNAAGRQQRDPIGDAPQRIHVVRHRDDRQAERTFEFEHQLVDRITSDAAKLGAENPSSPIPIDLLTSSGSGLDPDITPAAAQFQVPRISQTRNIPESTLRALIDQHTRQRQLGILGEPRVNVMELNAALDAR